MEPSEARQHLDGARDSYQSAVLPPMPAWMPVTCGVLIGSGVALAGQAAPTPWLRVLLIGVAVALAGVGVLLYSSSRRKNGVRGLRGSARGQASTLTVCAIAFLISAVNASAELRWIYVAIGVIVGLAVVFVLGRRR
ncbi:hypothetical protein ACLMAJ_32945 [Nocardia sp. KC 131]|uniref:hypothetical protein n=1 Tax=Nocardia arseniciresistens TaxID=3392119 RepID=UPI00398E71D9